MKALSGFSLLIALTGCAAPQVYLPVQDSDYGETPENHQDKIKTYMASRLKDAESARYDFNRTPVKAWLGSSTRYYGWATCVGINAKNSYGGYTGWQPHYFFFRGGDIAESVSGGADGSGSNVLVREMCSRL